MIYEWRCTKCNEVQETQRSVDDRDIAPDGTRDGEQVIIGEVSVDYAAEGGCASTPGYEHQWVRIMSAPNVPFEHLYDRGTFERTGLPR